MGWRISIILSFIFRSALSTGTGTVLGAGDTAENKIDTVSAFVNPPDWGRGREGERGQTQMG